jgi:hypothetical protein
MATMRNPAAALTHHEQIVFFGVYGNYDSVRVIVGANLVFFINSSTSYHGSGRRRLQMANINNKQTNKQFCCAPALNSVNDLHGYRRISTPRRSSAACCNMSVLRQCFLSHQLNHSLERSQPPTELLIGLFSATNCTTHWIGRLPVARVLAHSRDRANAAFPRPVRSCEMLRHVCRWIVRWPVGKSRSVWVAARLGKR